MAPFGYNGQLVRKVYSVCFSFSETQFPGNTYYATMNVVVLANLGDTPYITSYAVLNASTNAIVPTVSTYGTDTSVVFFLTGNPATVTATTPLGNYSNCPTTIAGAVCTTYRPTCTSGANFSAVFPQLFIRCSTPPGVGVSHAWSLFLSNVPVPSSMPLITSYTAPTVVNVSGNGALLTAGGSVVTITGGHLGPYAAVNGTTLLTYGVNNEYTCTPLAAIAGQDVQRTIRCSAGVGAGAGLPFRLVAGNQILLSASLPGVTNPAFSYAPPSITMVSVSSTFVEPTDPIATSIGSLPTAGGTLLYVLGNNFGPATDPLGAAVPLAVSYGPSLTANTYFMTGCARLAGAAAHTRLTCLSAPGVGTGLRLSLSVAGTAAAGPTNGSVVSRAGLAYSPPSVVSLSGSGASNGPTTGGAQLVVMAFGTGPVGSLPDGAVTFGTPGLLRFTATQCTVLVPHVGATPGQISCLTPPGTGGNLVVQLVVGGQYAPLYNTTRVSYGAPVITAFERVSSTDSITAFGTPGNETVLIDGMNFGPADGIAAITATYTTLRFGGGPTAPQPPLSLLLSATGCVVSQAHVQLRCTTAAGAGANLQVSLRGE